ncbi:TetR/AcrR family transcriptional regulator [Priestia megaterium]|uniref:Bacterial regulatory s, tetR family protein n=1 Tax=Priestia megaterium (strain ATCC 14581 / DSM 32 / CCUG 1817 / JCM 2506 / NBRC 15308 / NCIMB 9376 / NCTC 10342 / NRRL B-14308 / VKM B-512 / Ford 19) TaxID=1348623 RepID=A0A0B6A5X4_PRIM2|nr:MULTISPECIES: TetR/AcrR family transcriptional regulator [Priestia]MEB2276157.1 TetR/AcrR family transcriptional regulator [Bacillus sp. ILBB4]AJI20345.1 bacterial regulatory s, tetR family protein [Priestia megaterium NBRC 15308 = ATCC 14581]KFM97819.1 bacterial regulatory s, tetR family protein [Priestia megaterium]KGJ73762.1 TetR family transcriptional regulator [Priestia megaterium NBRC 15308 = ATCC 14581]KLV32001.1 TetR family transcriptional regulator [Priestia megaterium]
MNKKKLQSEQTKRKVADAAKALFSQKGYKATSIEEIVEATGSSKGNIYYHFKSKEGLFLYLIDEWDLEWERNWKERESLYKTTRDKLFGIAEQIILDDLNHPLTKAADEFFNNEEKGSDIEERIDEMVKRHVEFNRELLQKGIDEGEFSPKNAEQLAVILEGLFVGMSRMSRKMNTENALQLYHSAIDVFLNGIIARSS